MKRSRNLAVMFLLGAALGGGALGFTADRVMTSGQKCAKEDQQAMRDQMAEELGLSAAQRAAFDTILDARHQQLVEVMKPVRPRIDSIRLNARAQLARQLTAEQQTLFYARIAEMEKKRNK
jgi:Spy/CpxP family protein refolding chaperone